MRSAALESFLFVPVCVALAGCGVAGRLVPSAPVSPVGHALQGRVLGGQQPVSGAAIQLYAVGTAGDGSASTPLLMAAVASDANGMFSITGDYTCPSASTLVYLAASGGNAGSGMNGALAMMTALGACGGLSSGTIIRVDERTTVAAVAALAPYMRAMNAVGSSALDGSSLSAAFTLASSLVNPMDGTVPGPSLPANASSPGTAINTLADAVASCINSAGNTGTATACGQLFALTTEPGANPPADTVGALLALTRDPAMNAVALYNLATPVAPFQPQLASAPASWSIALSGSVAPAPLVAGCDAPLLTGASAFTDYTRQQPQTCRRITAADLPAPDTASGASNYSTLVARGNGQMPVVPPGFTVTLYATGLNNPRHIVTAPNGDLFVSESGANRITILRGVTASGAVQNTYTFASGFNGYPYGLLFYPASNPQSLYVTGTTTLGRFDYTSGNTVGANYTTLATDLPANGNHITRGLMLAPDGQHLLISVGSFDNYSNTDTTNAEFHRAAILSYTMAGVFDSIYASGLRNPVEMAADASGRVWVSVNERDGLGDDVPADYVTHVQPGGFYGYPWYYNGANPEPRLPNNHPELAAQTLVGDTLLQPHFAPLQLTFYNATQFPGPYRGDIFVASHGSWNKAVRAGYEVVRVMMANGNATGAFEDFMGGFVNADGTVWGRPAGIAVGSDGALYVADDGGNCVWRVAYTGN